MGAPCSFFADGSGLCFKWLMLQPVPRLLHSKTPAINATSLLYSLNFYLSFLRDTVAISSCLSAHANFPDLPAFAIKVSIRKQTP
jgi:hypothetical protein